MPPLNVDDLNAELSAMGAGWSATANKIAALSDEDKIAMLGTEEDLNSLHFPMAESFEDSEIQPAFRSYVDWRTENCITRVKNQGRCKNCTTFAVIAVVEAMITIEHKPLQILLSEADLHFCTSETPTCKFWWPDPALTEMASHGACLESYFPYRNAFAGTSQPRCLVGGSDREARAAYITDHTSLMNINERKNHVSMKGPCVASMRVFDDFYNYKTGVYHRRATSKSMGLHSVAVIGYSEPSRAWLCKNSWGSGWGELGGFFWIGYGEAGIDTEFPFWSVRGTIPPDLLTSVPPAAMA